MPLERQVFWCQHVRRAQPHGPDAGLRRMMVAALVSSVEIDCTITPLCTEYDSRQSRCGTVPVRQGSVHSSPSARTDAVLGHHRALATSDRGRAAREGSRGRR